MTLEQEIHGALVDLKNNIPFSILGICFHLDHRMQRADIKGYEPLLYTAFQAWPKFSGQKTWPVPCPMGESPEQAYSSAGSHTMWNAKDPYGALRLELLDFLIEHFEAKL